MLCLPHIPENLKDVEELNQTDKSQGIIGTNFGYKRGETQQLGAILSDVRILSPSPLFRLSYFNSLFLPISLLKARHPPRFHT